MKPFQEPFQLSSPVPLSDPESLMFNLRRPSPSSTECGFPELVPGSRTPGFLGREGAKMVITFTGTRRPPRATVGCGVLSPRTETWHSRPRTEKNPSQPALVSFSNARARESCGPRTWPGAGIWGVSEGTEGLRGLALPQASPTPKITYKENLRSEGRLPSVGQIPCSSSLKLFV